MNQHQHQRLYSYRPYNRYSVFFILIAVLLSACQNKPAPDERSISNRIDELMTDRIDSIGPGAVVLVQKNGELLYHKAFGKADLETGMDMEVDHVFDLASITKEFTAAAILQLEEKGLLSVKDDIHKYYPDYPTENKVITIEHLLTHTSGIRNHMDMDWANGPVNMEFDSTSEVLDYFKSDSLVSEPGEKFAYCNTGYQLLGHIIEQVSGISYADYLNKHLIGPSGMTETSYPRDRSEVKKLSTGYEAPDGNIVKARDYALTQNCGQSGLHGTALDLSKWYDALLSHDVISEKNLKRAWTSAQLSDGSPTNYGLAWNVEEKFDEPTISHTGFMFGHSSTDLYYPNDSLLIIVLSNIADIKEVNTNEIAFDISSYFFPDRILELTEEELDQFVGVYEVEPGFAPKVFREGTQLYVEVAEGKPDKVVAISPNRFKVKDFDANAEFIKDEKGVYSKLILSRAGTQYEGLRKEDVQ